LQGVQSGMTLLDRTVPGASRRKPSPKSKPGLDLDLDLDLDPALARMIEGVETPALVLDERIIARQLQAAARLRERCGCRVLYALKPLLCPFVLELMEPALDGFGVSSLFEARLAHAVTGDPGRIHITTPGFRPAEIPALDELCGHIAFNSLSQ